MARADRQAYTNRKRETNRTEQPSLDLETKLFEFRATFERFPKTNESVTCPGEKRRKHANDREGICGASIINSYDCGNVRFVVYLGLSTCRAWR